MENAKGLPYGLLKLPQNEAGYTPYGADPASGRGCASCRWFNAFGANCHIVEGEIVPTGNSDWFTPLYPELSMEELLEDLPEASDEDSQPIEVMEETAYANVGKQKSFWDRLKSLWQPTPASELAFDTPTGFKMVGDNRWIAWYTNGYQDRDQEWCATKAIETDIESMWANNQFPELWYAHIKGTKHGQADWVGMLGRFAVASGTFDDTPLARSLKAFHEKNAPNEGVSHGFHYDPEKKIKGVYHEFHTFEISPLPAEKASNIFTPFAIIKGVETMATQEQLEMLSKAIGEKEAQALIATAESATKTLDAEIAFKAKADPEEDDETDPKKKKAEEDSKKEFADLTAQVSALSETVKMLADIVITQKQAEEAQKSTAPKSAQAPILLDERKQKLLDEMTNNREKHIDLRTNDAGANLMGMMFPTK